MRRYNSLHTWLVVAAIAGWLLFVLGCTGWPAWSQDGRQVLMPYLDKAKGQTSIALIDVNTRTGRTLYECPREYCGAQWSSRGTVLIFEKVDSDSLGIVEIGTGNNETPKHIAVLEDEAFALMPVPEFNGSVYLYAKQNVRVHLASGTVHRLGDFGAAIPLPWNNERILYIRPLDSSSLVEVGEMTAEALSQNALFEISKSDPRLENPEELVAYTATTDPERSRLAMVNAHSDRDDILIFGRAGLQRVVKPAMPPGKYRLGSLQWSRNGQVIYASATMPVSDKQMQWAVAEINVRSGAVHLYPLARLNTDKWSDRDALCFAFNISLSPDGRTIAANGALDDSEEMSADDRGLFLIDLKKRESARVTKIPLSAIASPTAGQ